MFKVESSESISPKPSMPSSSVRRTGSSRSRGKKSAGSSNLNASLSSAEGLYADERKRPSGRFRRAPKSTAETSTETPGSSTEENGDDVYITDDHELQQLLYDCLQDCSRQRLRALHMALRKCGSIEARITPKELKDVLQEYNIKISGRAYNMLVECYEDSLGIDYEAMWKIMVAAQANTGRDSVMAQNKKNDPESSRVIFSHERRDEDLIRRLKEQFIKAKGKYKLSELKSAFQVNDRSKTGKLKKVDMVQACTETNMPVYGALLNGLLNRCDEERSGSASWPEFMSFLEKAHAEAGGVPDMKTVNEEPANPAPQSPRPATAAPPKIGNKHPKGDNNNKSQDSNSRSMTTPSRGKQTRRARSSLKQRQQQKQEEKENDKSETKPVNSKTPEPQEATPKPENSKSNTPTPVVKTKGPPPDSNDENERIPAPIAKELVQNAFKKAVGESADSSSKKDKTADKGKEFSKGTPKDELKKTSNQVKSATGFFNSMKTLLKAGNTAKAKKEDSSTIPVIHVEGGDKSNPRPTSSKPSPSQSPTPASKSPAKPISPKPTAKSQPAKAQPPAKSQSAGDSLEANIKGRKIVLPNTEDQTVRKGDTDPPQSRLKFEWAYGYRGNDCRSNIHIVKSGEVTYFIGHVVVLLNREAQTQRHYREHTTEIKSMAVHSNGITMATGQMTSNDRKEEAHVRLWRSDSLQTLHIVGKGSIMSSVECLSFSKTQTYLKTAFPEDRQKGFPQKDRLCAIDSSNDHTIFVWDIESGSQVASSKTDLEVVCDVMFSPKTTDSIVIIGKEHLAWWTVFPDNGSVLLNLKADYQTYLRPKFVTCLNHTEKGDLITGDSNGTIYVWGAGGNIITNLIKHAHEGPVFSVMLSRGTLLTGGRDGKIFGWVWSKNMDQSGQLEIPKMEGGVRMLQIHKDTLLMGTTTNSILTARLSGSALRNPLSGVKLDKAPLTQGHFDNVRGLCVPANPDMPHLALTAGNDGIVSMYDTGKKTPLWKYFLKSTRIICSDINYGASLLAVGTRDSILLYGIKRNKDDEIEMEELCKVKVSSAKLNVIKLSPDCESIAAADLEGNVHVIGVVVNDDDEECWDLVSQWKAHKTMVVGMDWSIETQADDAYYLRTSSVDGELLFWNSDTGDRLKSISEIKDIKWLSHNVTMSAGVLGIWHSKQVEEGDITAVDVSPNQALVAMGVTNGSVSVFKYPAKKGGFSHTYKANQTVVRAMFTMNSKKLITIGGEDSSVIQWAVI